MAGRKVASSKLRVGYFAQHQVDELELDETPLQHLARLRPDEPPGKLRGRLAAGGIGADIVTTEVGRLSGGQKARLRAAPRHARRAAPDHPRRADQPSRHREPRGAGRGADRVRRRGDPGQPRPAPGRAGRRPAVAGEGRPGARPSTTTWTPTAGMLLAERGGAPVRAREEKPKPRAAAAAPRSRRCAPRSRSARRGSRKLEEMRGDDRRAARQPAALRARRQRGDRDAAEEARRGRGRARARRGAVARRARAARGGGRPV